jgi:uncharacterized membrane protein
MRWDQTIWLAVLALVVGALLVFLEVSIHVTEH